MVVDNVDDVETFFPSRKRQRHGNETDASAQIPLATYLPQSRNGAILVTSRSQDAATRLVGGYNRTKGVLAMDEEEGMHLLRNKLQDPPVEESALDLLRAPDCIPLAVVQAAAYINRRGRMTIAGYLADFRNDSKKRERLLKWDAGELRRDESASNSVVTTWQMSFEQIQRERRSAAELLSLMSFFIPQGIPELEDDEDADSAFDEDLDTLQAYSLVTMTADTDAFEMHALVQFCTRVWLSSCSDAQQREQRFVVLMAQELPDGEHENWTKCQQLLPHVEPLFSTQPAGEKALKAWAQVLYNVAWYLSKIGNYSVAHQLAAKAVAANEKAWGREDLKTMASIDVLAAVLGFQGKYEEAETLHRGMLEVEETHLGDDHPDTLTSMNNLAIDLHCQGRYEEAETLHRRVLEWSEKKLGQDHPDTLNSVNNLAVLLGTLHRYPEADGLYQRACDGLTQQLGSRHPHTIMARKNFAAMQQKAIEARLAQGDDLPPGSSKRPYTTRTRKTDVD
ncbi:TPR-like protein [Alternaria alternata]|nr:TPR-like protein [Alternaria alternata]